MTTEKSLAAIEDGQLPYYWITFLDILLKIFANILEMKNFKKVRVAM